MLVLRRRAGEAIVISGDVEIEIIEISRTRVKLGVTAPRTVPVVRKETIPVAEQNRKASELLPACGREGIAGILEVLNALPPKVSDGSTDKKDSIPERGNRE